MLPSSTLSTWQDINFTFTDNHRTLLVLRNALDLRLVFSPFQGPTSRRRRLKYEHARLDEKCIMLPHFATSPTGLTFYLRSYFHVIISLFQTITTHQAGLILAWNYTVENFFWFPL